MVSSLQTTEQVEKPTALLGSIGEDRRLLPDLERWRGELNHKSLWLELHGNQCGLENLNSGQQSARGAVQRSLEGCKSRGTHPLTGNP